MPIKVIIWNEGSHEKVHPEVTKIYPDHMDGAIANGINRVNQAHTDGRVLDNWHRPEPLHRL